MNQAKTAFINLINKNNITASVYDYLASNHIPLDFTGKEFVNKIHAVFELFRKYSFFPVTPVPYKFICNYSVNNGVRFRD